MRKLLCCVTVALLAAACDKAPEPIPVGSSRPVAPAPRPSSGGTPSGSQPTAGSITWTKPNAWTQAESPSPMRKATYKIAKVAGDSDDAEMSVTQVGGSVEDNIKRWEGQFDGAPKAKTTDKDVNGVKVTIVELAGTFKGGGPMMGGGDSGPKEGWVLLAAIAHTQPAHFFKMTGPAKTIEAARADFDVLVGSITPGKP